jgi:hypothetical protein
VARALEPELILPAFGPDARRWACTSSIRIHPARGRISGHGALDAARGSTVAHHCKWVTAHLRLRPFKQLAGRTLRLAVQATDVHGGRQLEPLAGSLTINH